MGGKHDICIAVILSEAKNLLVLIKMQTSNLFLPTPWGRLGGGGAYMMFARNPSPEFLELAFAR